MADLKGIKSPYEQLPQNMKDHIFEFFMINDKPDLVVMYLESLGMDQIRFLVHDIKDMLKSCEEGGA